MKNLTPEQAAERLGVTRQTVYDLLRTKKLRGFKVGRLWRVPVSALEEMGAE